MTSRIRAGFTLFSALVALSFAGCSAPTAATAPGATGGKGGTPPPTAGTGGAPATPPPGNDAAPGGGGAGGGSAPADAAPDKAPPPPDAAPSVVTPPASKPSPNPPAEPPGPWARNIQVGLVEISQAVFIKVAQGDMVVPPAMRNAPVIEARPLFARIHVAPEMGFSPRMLRAVLSVAYADMTKFEIQDTKMVAGASNVEQLATTFNFLVPADKVKPASTMVVSIYETGAAAGADPAMPPRFPRTGAVDLGVKAGRMEMTVVAVPVGDLMDTPERRKKLEDDVYDLYPVQKVTFRFHAPVMLAGGFSRTSAFAALRDARTGDNAKPDEYYHLLVNTTGAGFSGTSNRAGPTVNDGARRVAITIVGNSNTIDGNTNTVAHELGHNHGSAHAPGCGAAGPDATYPYTMPPGDMGVNGFSVNTLAFKSRMMWRELMSYCRPRWISDFMFRRFEERVRIVTGFSPAAMGQMMATRSLQGYAGPGEEASWGIVPGQLVDATASMTPTRYAVLRLADGREVRAPVAVNLMTDDETREFAINLTGADYSDADIMEAEVVIDGQRTMVPVGGLQRPR